MGSSIGPKPYVLFVAYSSLGSASVVRTPCLLRSLLQTMREFNAQCDDFTFACFVYQLIWGLDLVSCHPSQVAICDPIFNKLGV